MKPRTLLVVLVGTVLAIGAAVGVLGAASEGTAASAEPPSGGALTAARFSIVIDGVEVGAFSELAGISSGVDPVELELQTRGAERLLRLPAKRRPPAVTLSRGLSSSLEIAAWHEAAMADSASARKSASLVMFAVDGTPVARYHLENAWPSLLEISALRAGASAALIETVTLVSENIQRIAP